MREPDPQLPRQDPEPEILPPASLPEPEILPPLSLPEPDPDDPGPDLSPQVDPAFQY
jgi:hypothetical protein